VKEKNVIIFRIQGMNVNFTYNLDNWIFEDEIERLATDKEIEEFEAIRDAKKYNL